MTRDIGIGFVVLALLIIGGAYAFIHSSPGTSVSSSADEAAVRQVVTEFGAKLQMVSLLSPEADRRAAMDANYGPYVAPELLTAWEEGGAEALGRSTSSPWPDHIDIVNVQAQGAEYVVEGNVIEVANSAADSTAPVATYPVTLRLEKRGDAWFIVSTNKGSYSELPQSQTITGLWECLPPKDPSGPHTLECAFGIAADQGGHYAVDTSLMSAGPVDFSTGAHVRATGIVMPVEQLSSIQKYDIVGVLRATAVEEL